MSKEKTKSKIIYCKFWTVKTLEKNRNTLYVFGDNDIREGMGGQAIIRGQKNAVGVPTKKSPNLTDYYTDKEYYDNKVKIKSAVKKVYKKFKNDKYKYLCLPEDGLGTGLAKMPDKCPRTYKYLLKKLRQLINKINEIK